MDGIAESTPRRTTMPRISRGVRRARHVVLAAVGIAGVLARAIAERRRELGILCMAVGSSPAGINSAWCSKRGARLGAVRRCMLGGFVAFLSGASDRVQLLLRRRSAGSRSTPGHRGRARDRRSWIACARPGDGRRARLTDPVDVLSLTDPGCLVDSPRIRFRADRPALRRHLRDDLHGMGIDSLQDRRRKGIGPCRLRR